MSTVRTVAADLMKLLTQEGFDVQSSFDDDGDASILACWRGCGDAHGRYGVIEENGVCTYALIGFQGKTKVAHGTDVSAERFVEAMRRFRNDPSTLPSFS